MTTACICTAEADAPGAEGAAMAEVVPLSATRPPPSPVRIAPLASAVAPLRARHGDAVRSVATWSLARGRPCDLDVVAVCIEAMERHRCPDGLHLDRPTVCRVLMGGAHNETTFLGTQLPEDWHIQLWNVVRWLHDDGLLSSDSDPLSALLEPLGCYGRLDADGHPMPDGVDVDFPCQCFVPHDPTCPPDLAQFIVGRDPNPPYRQLVARARLRLRSEDPPLSSFHPLFSLSKRVRREGSYFDVHADDFLQVGEIDACGEVPQLWLYVHEPTRRRGFDPLALDEHGHGWVANADRRYTAGFRWIRVDDSRALTRAGLSWAPVQREPVADISYW